MGRYIEDRRSQTLFVNGSLETLLPECSVARVIWDGLRAMDFSAFEAAYCNDTLGRPAVDPRRLAGVWALGLLRGVTSSVALARSCAQDIEFRWMLGDAPVEKSTLSEFRKRHVEALRDLSTQILAALARSGQLPGNEMVVDGTVIRAAASCSASASRKALKKRVAKLRETIEEKLAAGEEETEPVREARQRQARFEAALQEMEALGLTGDEDRITWSEPEASVKKLKGGGAAPAHNVQAVCDAASGAIVSVAVVEQGNDQGLLESQVRQAERVLAEVAEHLEAAPGPMHSVCADGAYHDTLQLATLEAEGIAAVVPDGHRERQAPGVSEAFRAHAFTYDPEHDTLQCPQGHILRRQGCNEGGTAARYRAGARDCAGCPCKPACCPNARASGRTVHRSVYPEVMEAIAQRVESPEGRRLLHARHVTSEGDFARMVERLHWRRCRVWGKLGAYVEGLWRQITHNLLLWTGYWKPLVAKAA